MLGLFTTGNTWTTLLKRTKGSSQVIFTASKFTACTASGWRCHLWTPLEVGTRRGDTVWTAAVL